MEQKDVLAKAGVAHMAEAPDLQQPHPNLPAPEAEEDDEDFLATAVAVSVLNSSC